MNDIYDLFAEQSQTYSGSLWLWRSTQGITVLRGDQESLEAAEEALRAHTRDLSLRFNREHHEVDTFASHTYDENCNLAVVVRDSTGDVVSYARLPDGFG